MTYERPHALARCLESIRRLEAPGSSFEVIVVDDGSKRRPKEPLESAHPGLRLRYEWIPHQGVAAARNVGMRLARGSLVAFIADDYALPTDYLARVDELLELYPEAGVITFNVRSVGPGLGPRVQQMYHDLVLLQNAGGSPDEEGVIETESLPASRAAVFHRWVFDRVGPFDESLRAGEDGDMGERLAAAGIPLLFVHDYYVDHHEEKDLLDFLRQRREYAASHFRVVETRRRPTDRRRWTLARSARAVVSKLWGWVHLSRRYGRFARFCLLSPGLVLFLSRFYLTLWILEKEEREPLGVVDRVRAGLNTATRVAAVRGAVMTLMEVLCSLAARILRAGGLASTVFVRGSYATGAFRPFLSDIDLVILVPRTTSDPYETSRALHRRLRVVRAVQPFARDPWQTILPEAQWAIVERYGYLLGADSWRPIAGASPWTGTGTPDPRSLLAAWWNRQHLWTVIAQSQALRHETGLRQLGASLKKSGSFMARIRRHTAETHAHGNESRPDLARSILELSEGARSVERELHLEKVPDVAADDRADSPTKREASALEILSEGIDLESEVRALIATEGFLCVVIEDDRSTDRVRSLLAGLEPVYARSGLRTFLYPESALSFAPLLRPMRVLHAHSDARLPSWPQLLEEQLLYESLFQATHLWVVGGRSDPASLRRHVVRAAELCAYFVTGRPRRRASPALEEVVAELRELDDVLRRRLSESSWMLDGRDGDEEDPDARALFTIGTVLTERLAELLHAREPRAGAHSAATVT